VCFVTAAAGPYYYKLFVPGQAVTVPNTSSREWSFFLALLEHDRQGDMGGSLEMLRAANVPVLGLLALPRHISRIKNAERQIQVRV
jgi:hypothetical protein